MHLNNLENTIPDQTRSFEAGLVQLCRKLGFDHAFYAHMNKAADIISGFTTCPSSLVSAYISRNLHKQDPIIEHGLEFTRPIDWSAFRDDPRYRNFFGFLITNGFGENGITVPLRVSRSETGLVSVTKDCSREAWGNIINKTMPGLRKEAKDIHQMALTLSPVKLVA